LYKDNQVKVITQYPVAYDSPDHLYPWGTARDNTTDHGFIDEVEKYFNNIPLKVLDIGCSGGQLVVDFNARGHQAVGIEGSDYSVKTQRANWPSYQNICLFTCDATKPYDIVDDSGALVAFDLITAWEVVEHIKYEDLDAFFGNILKHMHSQSIFCASIAPIPDVQGGYTLHQSVYSAVEWKNNILPKYFQVYDLPFHNKVRYGDSFHVMLKKLP
jgi:cyclopropane fatty-acyl-phospholipid synthase-like methyltransferase